MGMICVNGKRESPTKSTRVFGLLMINDNVFKTKPLKLFQSDSDLFHFFFSDRSFFIVVECKLKHKKGHKNIIISFLGT